MYSSLLFKSYDIFHLFTRIPSKQISRMLQLLEYLLLFRVTYLICLSCFCSWFPRYLILDYFKFFSKYFVEFWKGISYLFYLNFQLWISSLWIINKSKFSLYIENNLSRGSLAYFAKNSCFVPIQGAKIIRIM